jgi:hypothetical protein
VKRFNSIFHKKTSSLKGFKQFPSKNLDRNVLNGVLQEDTKFKTFRVVFFKSIQIEAFQNEKYPDRTISNDFRQKVARIETFHTDSLERCLDRNVSNDFLQKATTSKHFEWILFEKVPRFVNVLARLCRCVVLFIIRVWIHE